MKCFFSTVCMFIHFFLVCTAGGFGVFFFFFVFVFFPSHALFLHLFSTFAVFVWPRWNQINFYRMADSFGSLFTTTTTIATIATVQKQFRIPAKPKRLKQKITHTYTSFQLNLWILINQTIIKKQQKDILIIKSAHQMTVHRYHVRYTDLRPYFLT